MNSFRKALVNASQIGLGGFVLEHGDGYVAQTWARSGSFPREVVTARGGQRQDNHRKEEPRKTYHRLIAEGSTIVKDVIFSFHCGDTELPEMTGALFSAPLR